MDFCQKWKKYEYVYYKLFVEKWNTNFMKSNEKLVSRYWTDQSMFTKASQEWQNNDVDWPARHNVQGW